MPKLDSKTISEILSQYELETEEEFEVAKYDFEGVKNKIINENITHLTKQSILRLFNVEVNDRTLTSILGNLKQRLNNDLKQEGYCIKTVDKGVYEVVRTNETANEYPTQKKQTDDKPVKVSKTVHEEPVYTNESQDTVGREDFFVIEELFETISKDPEAIIDFNKTIEKYDYELAITAVELRKRV